VAENLHHRSLRAQRHSSAMLVDNQSYACTVKSLALSFLMAKECSYSGKQPINYQRSKLWDLSKTLHSTLRKSNS